MVDNTEIWTLRLKLFEQWLDELMQVIDLLQFTSTVLIEFAVARQDMQSLEQLWGLFWTDIGFSHMTQRVAGGIPKA